MDQNLKPIITFTVPCLIFIVISLPLIFKKIPRNHVYGFRTEKTLMNDDIWYKANKYGGKSLLMAATVALMGYVVLTLNRERLSYELINAVAFGLFIVPIVISVFFSLIYIRKL